ncbi:hypothetical protein [Hahella ganghwensis]|uniref:hypothetical protein n=1 Tax=Hahella ganghwensis TaxID=286420 RepID=UPI00039D0304|nr:hypothetical protein [Hahella ganghwensis]
MNSLSILGMGLVSSVGYDALTCTSSVRAGLTRFRPLDDVVTYDPDELEAPVIGAPAHLLTSGFVQNAAWLRMVEQAMKDLIQSAKLPAQDPTFWQNTPVIWILPEITHWRFGWPELEVVSILQQHCVATLSKTLGVSIQTPDHGLITQGATGLYSALGNLLKTDHAESSTGVILISVDSLLDPLCLKQLSDYGRLLDDENSASLIPGEAASCLYLDFQANGQGGHAPVNIISTDTRKVELRSSSTDDAEDRDSPAVQHLEDNASELGQALALSIKDTLSVLTDTSFIGDIYIDLNGERWKSLVWGFAQTHLQGLSNIKLDHCNVQVPATSWGDIGAASSAASLCLANASFLRGYARGTMALVCSINESGTVGSALVIKGEE